MLLIANVWSLVESDNRAYAKNEMSILILDPRGHRLWQQKIERTSDLSGETVPERHRRPRSARMSSQWRRMSSSARSVIPERVMVFTVG